VAADADLLRRHLENLSIGSLAEWDMLAFLYRHGSSIASAEQLARYVGYTSAVVEAALDSLTSTGLVVRSRNYGGVRLYQLNAAPADAARRLSIAELNRIGAEREGRLLLIEYLRSGEDKKQQRRKGWHLA
jgi:DNA-binding MarR family transcriptional regulator